MDQKRERDSSSLKKSKKDMESNTTIKPTLSVRVALQNPADGPPAVKAKYVPPKPKKLIKIQEDDRKRLEEELNFCQYEVLKMPSPQNVATLKIKYEAPSAEIKEAKVMPRKPSATPSDLYPDPPKKKDLKLKKPKSGIFINEAKKKRRKKAVKPVPPKKEPSVKSASKTSKKSESYQEENLTTIQEYGEDFYEDFQDFYDDFNQQEEEGLDETPSRILTKKLRHKVSQISKTTSIQSKDYKDEEEEEDMESKIIQKFRRDSEQQRYEMPARKKPKKGTFENFSYTKLKQPTLKNFYFGVKLGTIHQGDDHFNMESRNHQGMCMPIAAYCYSMLKHPDKWAEADIDEVLEAGDELFRESAKKQHIHGDSRELGIDELRKYCRIDGKKIRFQVSEPEVSGYIRSDDKKIYNLTKALNIFFGRNSAGILQSDHLNIALWRDKHFYLFDAKPRTIDLYSTEQGASLMAHFYDITSIITVLLERSDLKNPPFIMYKIEAFKVVDKNAEEIDSNLNLNEKLTFKILDDSKAVISGSYDIADKCFGFSRSKQALTVALIALIYSKITPPSVWMKPTIDKILVIGNQLFLECVQCDQTYLMDLADLPAVFTLGPYVIEIYIYANRLAGMMVKKGECMLLKSLEKFFEKNNNALVQIDDAFLAVWRQRDLFHCFDPYSRGPDGLRTRDGAACSTMHSTLESMVGTIATNFDAKDLIFHIHALKIVKIFRDPDKSILFPKNQSLNDYPVDNFKKCRMKKTRKSATAKPVTVDYTNRATLYGKNPDDSILEVSSNVQSLGPDEVPAMVHKFPSKSVLKLIPPDDDFVADLDSPSLSDTQIEPDLPEESEEDDDYICLEDNYDTAIEEEELMTQGEDEGSRQTGEGSAEGSDEFNLAKEMEAASASQQEEEWYYTTPVITQIGSHSLPSYQSRMSVEINTDMTFLNITKEVVPPTNRKTTFLKHHRRRKPQDDDLFDLEELMVEPDVTQSEELRKETNFYDLPDNSQILSGSKNLSSYGQDLEFMAPFVGVMANAVAKKYAISSWSKDIVDYVLKCGSDLYAASNTRYDQVYKLILPKISLGRTDFRLEVRYLFDAFLKQRVLELALSKILFTKCPGGVLVTPAYACAIFKHNHLYYLFDGFGNNEVGLGTGTDKGTACLARFKNVHSMVVRILHNKNKREKEEVVEYNRFVLSACVVKKLKKDLEKEEEEMAKQKGEDAVPDDDDEKSDLKIKKYKKKSKKPRKDEHKDAENKVGYQLVDGVYKIEATRALEESSNGDNLNQDFFACLCACLLLLDCPVKKWDTKKMDLILDQGEVVFSNAEDLSLCLKKTVKNILIEDYFFNVIAKKIKFESYTPNRSIRDGMEALLSKKQQVIFLQFPTKCFVVSVTKHDFHLYDPHDASGKASWILFKSLKDLVRKIEKMVGKKDSYNFFKLEVTSITKAPKNVVLAYRLQQYKLKKDGRLKGDSPPPSELPSWLKEDPASWAFKLRRDRDSWFEWRIEFANDLYSLFGNIHQKCDLFSEKSRGKQTLANLVVAIGMTEIYELKDWTAAILDSILIHGDSYFTESVKDIKDLNYEIAMDDLSNECHIFPYKFGVKFTPVVDGTMFLVSLKKFNLAKAIWLFFEDFTRRYGIIMATRGTKKRQVAFGKINELEYFLYDCECWGGHMFVDDQGVGYILRTTSLIRLLHVLTLTLGGGDFYIFEVGTTELTSVV